MGASLGEGVWDLAETGPIAFPFTGRQAGMYQVMSCINEISPICIYCVLAYLYQVLLGDFSACCHANSPLYQETGSPTFLFFHPCSACPFVIMLWWLCRSSPSQELSQTPITLGAGPRSVRGLQDSTTKAWWRDLFLQQGSAAMHLIPPCHLFNYLSSLLSSLQRGLSLSKDLEMLKRQNV